MRKLKILVCFVAAMLILGAFCVRPCLANLTYSGSLTSADGGILGNNGWVEPPDAVILSWTVTNMTTYWNYEYTFDITDNTGALSSFIIEVSDGVVLAEISGLQGAGSPEINLWDKQGFYDGPDPILGLKVSGFDEDGPWTISFNTLRNPVWGDFYAKDGSGNDAWNSGFSIEDPIAALHDGPEQGHLIVPDTTLIPAPGAVLLASIGVGLVGWLRRRRTL